MSRTATLRHVVLFGLKEATTAEESAEFVRRFAELKALVSEIESFEWGGNNSPEGLNQGHDYCFFLSFPTEEARDRYLVHPDHQAFATWAGALIENVTVVDYWASAVP